MKENVELYNDPNKYAESGRVSIDKITEVFGYQKFFISNSHIEAHPDDKKLILKKNFLLSLFNSKWFVNKSILDIGANAGFFSFYALLKGASSATALDMDSVYIKIMNKIKKAHNFSSFEVISKNIIEYYKPSDIVIAYGLIHWIYSCTSDYGSLDKAIEKLAELSNEVLVVEWIEPNDGAIDFFKHTEFNKEIINGPYNIDAFEEALSKYFSTFSFIGEVSPTRKIYIAKKNKTEELNINHSYKRIQLWEILAILNENNAEYVILKNWEIFTKQKDLFGDLTIEILTDEHGSEIINEFLAEFKARIDNKYNAYNIYNNDTVLCLKIIINNAVYINRDFGDRLMKSKVKHKHINILPKNELFLYVIYDTVFHIGAGANKYHKLITSSKKTDRIIDFNDLPKTNFLLNILKNHKIEEVDHNKMLNTDAMPYIKEAGQVIHSRILGTINGKVYISRIYKTDNHRVIKQTNFQLADREFKILNRFDSSYIVKAKNIITHKDYSFFELDFVDGFSLDNIDEFIKQFSIDDFFVFVEDCLNILCLLIENKIIHRDISKSNIIIRNKKPVLIDFGWAIEYNETFLTPPGLGQGNVPKDGVHNDFFAMGKLLEELNLHYGVINKLISLMLRNSSQNNIELCSTLRDQLLYVKKKVKAAQLFKYYLAKLKLLVRFPGKFS